MKDSEGSLWWMVERERESVRESGRERRSREGMKLKEGVDKRESESEKRG